MPASAIRSAFGATHPERAVGRAARCNAVTLPAAGKSTRPRLHLQGCRRGNSHGASIHLLRMVFQRPLARDRTSPSTVRLLRAWPADGPGDLTSRRVLRLPSKDQEYMAGPEAESLGRSPCRAAIATITPSGSPTHQVATKPHASASSVGDVVRINAGCPMVKYSRHTRTVYWSCMTPHPIAANNPSAVILANSTKRGVLGSMLHHRVFGEMV